jgi:hypothetical protein
VIGPAYRGKAARAILGSARSQLFPAVLWSGWLNTAGQLIAMTGVSHRNDDTVFGLNGWQIAALGLFDAADGTLVASADLDTPATPAAGEPLFFAVGDLTFSVA